MDRRRRRLIAHARAIADGPRRMMRTNQSKSKYRATHVNPSCQPNRLIVEIAACREESVPASNQRADGGISSSANHQVRFGPIERISPSRKLKYIRSG